MKTKITIEREYISSEEETPQKKSESQNVDWVRREMQ